ncbi:MAG: SDR family oxidoreductase [Patescibacteria group bacterium]
MTDILLTGVTGSLGKVLAQQLAKRGHKIHCLIRAPNKAAAEQRLREAIGDIRNVHAFRGDVTQENCGVNEQDPAIEIANISTIVHAAAMVDFFNAEGTWRTNVEGTENVLKLAERLGVERFIYVSTAYVIGAADRLDEQTPAEELTAATNTPYEQSKRAAEKLVRAWSKRTGTPVTIVRPSIITGRADGSMPEEKRRAFYEYVDALRKARNAAVHLSQHEVGSGFITEAGRVRSSVPLGILMSADARLNLVPIDWCAEMITHLVEVSHPGVEIVHLTDSAPLRTRDILAWTLDEVSLDNVQTVETPAELDKLKASQRGHGKIRVVQRTLEGILKSFKVYTNHAPVFETVNTRRLLGNHHYPPQVDETYIRRTLRVTGISIRPEKPLAAE